MLFLYSDHLDAQFHLDSACEMLRLAPEVRIFPLLTLAGQPSPHVSLVLDSVTKKGFGAAIVPVPYEFPKDGNQMLLLRRS